MALKLKIEMETSEELLKQDYTEDNNGPVQKPVGTGAEGEQIVFSPNAFLIPYILLMLRDSFLHGYAIWERLMVLGIPGLTEHDRAGIYRTLRQLEKEGKLKSEWDTSSRGPARRVYTLTESGGNSLKIWAAGLDQYRQKLDFFFQNIRGWHLS